MRRPREPIPSPLIDEFEAELRRTYPNLPLERTELSVRVPATTESGFPVELVDAGQEVVPVLGGWVEFGLDAGEAIPHFLAGLTGTARVREVGRAGVPYRWKAEFLRDGKWVPECTHYSFPLFPGPLPLFARKTERVLWNDPERLTRVRS